MKRMGKSILIVLVLLSLSPGSIPAVGQAETPEAEAKPFNIAIFVPGVVAGSPIYEQMVEGTQKAADEHTNVSVKVLEAGFNQAEWEEKMTSLAATGEYDLIVTSNPAMPFVSMPVAEKFPDQKWLNLDGYLDGNPQFATLLYNQMEMTYMDGYLGALVSTSKMNGANAVLKAGMVVAQEYPALTKLMKPGFEMGLKAVNPGFTLDYRVVGNWYDANKAADLANSMIDAGADVILTIAGGANQGVIKACQERGKYVLLVDANDYKAAPGTVVGCAVLNQSKAAYERVKMAIDGTLTYGRAEIVHTKDGYVDFADDDPLYINNVPEDIRAKMGELLKQMRSGDFHLEPPKL
ncbi:MAG: BMP family ABC transporter substrate-binding protein [Spirochaetaceae bacterium]|nr:MAG: BMP family ABC transporter substrate-binding protein [Spirochaetaceae bacterium]